MNLLVTAASRRTLQVIVLISIIDLSICEPQYSYLSPYYSYIPYTRSGYSRNSRGTPRPVPQITRRQSANKAAAAYYSPNLLTDKNASFKSQSERYKGAIGNRHHISKADAENAKFVGVKNQEANEESTKTLGLLRRSRFRRPLASPCRAFGRDAKGNSKASVDAKGRFLFDVNVYNVYSGSGGYGCGGYGDSLFGGGGGILGDALADAVAPPATPLENFLTLFAPGILQNSLAATARPRPQLPLQSDPLDENETDPGVDPAYNPRPIPPVRRPNRVYFDSAGATPVTPAQLIGGVATTVNGIIQQLTGNIQPVYPSYRNLNY